MITKRLAEVMDSFSRYDNLDEYGKAKKDWVHALWLGIQCIEAYNDDAEESKHCVEVLLNVMENLDKEHYLRHESRRR